MAVGVGWEEEEEEKARRRMQEEAVGANQGLMSSPKKRLLPCNSQESRAKKIKKNKLKKASPDVEGEEGGREGRVGSLVPLRGDSHWIEGTVPAIELGEGLFENRRESWLITLRERARKRERGECHWLLFCFFIAERWVWWSRQTPTSLMKPSWTSSTASSCTLSSAKHSDAPCIQQSFRKNATFSVIVAARNS